MENFVLYDEVGRGTHSIVYKGRRKGTINFVAIHCIDKCKRPEITNLVRLTHELDHPNIVKFHEWYETSNHLWLVVELCTGGGLDTVLSQDVNLPESSIRKFGIDLVKGLHHIHSLGIIFSDLKPSKLLLDGPGVLKFAGFQYGRLESENLEELFEHFTDSDWNNTDSDETISNIPKKYRTMGSPTYMSPEVFEGGEHSMSSDLWSLGCVFYEMFTGHPPYLADNFNDLMNKILHKECLPLKVKGSRVSGKPSPEFQSLVEGLMKKDPEQRLGWHGLVTHPFWQGQLAHLVADLELNTELKESLRESLRKSVASMRASQTSNDLPKVNSVLGHIQGVNMPSDRPMTGQNWVDTIPERPDSAIGDFLRPRTAQGGGDGTIAFTLSSRPCTAGTPVPEDMQPPQRLLTQSPTEVKDTVRKVKSEVTDDKAEVTQLIFHSSDFTISQIADNPKIMKPGSLKYDSKVLPVPPYSGEKIQKMSASEQEKHLKALHDALDVTEKGPPSQKRIHLLNYVATITTNSEIANRLTSMGVLSTLAKQVKDLQHSDVKQKMARVLGIIAHHTNEVEENVPLNEVAGILTEVLREQFRSGKLKIAVLPALGEVLYLIASQEEIKGHSVEAWNIQMMTYTLITRCLREGEDVVVNHYAAKVVENVATTTTPHAQKLAVNEVGLLLWYIFTHATADILKITALSAMTRLTKHNVSVFQSVIEKVGLPKILSTMHLQVTRIQQAIITMFACLITSDSSTRITRLIQDKDFIASVMRLLESPSMIIRGKAFLVILEITRTSPDVLLNCCQNRLVMYIERDNRKQMTGKADQLAYADYLSLCLDLLISSIVDAIPPITKDILGALETVSGRKHPSTVQVKQLKAVLPHTPIIHYVVTSQVFRPKIISMSFLKSLNKLLVHMKSIDSGSTSIQAATGPSGSEDFINTVFGIIEAIAQHPTILLEYHSVIIDPLLQSLASLVSSSSGDMRAHSLRLFSEMASLFLNTAEFDPTQHKKDSKKLHQIIVQTLLPQYEQILLEQDPIPSYGLRLLWALLEQNPGFIKQCEALELVPVIFQVLVDHQGSPISMTMQRVAGVISCLVSHRETNMNDLYEHGLVDHLVSVLRDVCNLQSTNEGQDLKPAQNMLQILLDTLHTVLKYVSDIVRRALQAKKGGNEQGNKEAEMAEQLLLRNKPVTQLIPNLTQLLVAEDLEISDLSLKSLSLVVQLFGGEHPDAMSEQNMQYYSDALKQTDAKKQKVILRMIKRMITTEKMHSDNMLLSGEHLITAIQSLAHTASSQAEVAIASLAADILRSIGKL